MASRINWLIWLHLAWFPALALAWLVIAGESGSPVHDYWPTLQRVQDVIEASFLPSALLLPLGPAALSAAMKGRRWAAAYPILLLLNCAGTIALGLRELHLSPAPIVAPSPRGTIAYDPCFSFATKVPAVDAVGKPIRTGDFVVIRTLPGSDSPMPDTPEGAVQRKEWHGRVVVVTGFIQGGALRFQPPDEDSVREAPRFCLWPDNVVHFLPR